MIKHLQYEMKWCEQRKPCDTSRMLLTWQFSKRESSASRPQMKADKWNQRRETTDEQERNNRWTALLYLRVSWTLMISSCFLEDLQRNEGSDLFSRMNSTWWCCRNTQGWKQEFSQKFASARNRHDWSFSTPPWMANSNSGPIIIYSSR